MCQDTDVDRAKMLSVSNFTINAAKEPLSAETPTAAPWDNTSSVHKRFPP